MVETSMNYVEYDDAEKFLAHVKPVLERNESTNGLMLGVCLRLVQEPEAYGSGRPYLAAVESKDGLSTAAVMTPPYKLQVYSEEDDNSGIEVLAEKLHRGNWLVPGVIARYSAAEEFASVWKLRTGISSTMGMRQGVYELRKVTGPADSPGEFRQATFDDLDLVREWAGGFHDACFGDDRSQLSVKVSEKKVSDGSLFLWIDGKPVSMAARSRPTPHGEAVSFVYTPKDKRRRGYASSLVAKLSQKILDEGKQFCTLYTDLSNTTSNSIYQRIGYVKVSEVVDINFDPEMG
jgi:uncharacterized protein